jgi:HEAT repeat protein
LIEAAKGEGHQSAAIEALGSLGGDAAIAFLTEASKSQDHSTAEWGTKALIDVYKRGCPIPVLIVGLKHPNPDVREAAAWSLTLQVPTMTEKKPVVEALSGSLIDPSHSVLRICAGALGALGDQTAVPALVEAFKSNYNPADYTSHFQAVEVALKKLAPERADQLLRELNPGLVKKQEKALRRDPDATMKKFYRGFALAGAVLGLIIGLNASSVGAAIGLSAVGAVVGYYLGAIVGAAVTSW